MPEIAVVIPTLKTSREQIPTLNHIPDDVEVHIQHESPISKARNRGVEQADTEYIIQLDDDIIFSEDLWDEIIGSLTDGVIIGMEDWDYGLIVTRMIAFPKTAWEEVGGFDELLGSHMEDTDFAIKLQKNGYNLSSIDQNRIEHVPHSNRITQFDRFWRLTYLCLKHPNYSPMLLKGTLL